MHSSNRREFLGFTALAAAAASTASAKPFGLPVGIQPWTVRNELQRDVDGTLKQLAAMGYQEIEVAVPFYGKQVAELRSLLKSLGLSSPSGSFAYPKDDSEWDRSIEQAATLEMKYMITSAPSQWQKTLDGWKRAATRFNELGARCRKQGMVFAYHNHHFEYKVLDGVVAYDELLRSTDPASVVMEMDTFWTIFAGKDPVEYFQKYPGRFPLLHIKDLKSGYPPSTDAVKGNPFAEVGQGIIDWKRIFKAAKAGLKHYFVEQDRWDREPLESARMSCDYLKKLKV